MKSHLQLCCILLALAGLLHAEVPRKPLPSKYRSLWTDSPFTAKPPPGTTEIYNDLQDYALLGVSPVQQGYLVTMIDRKNPSERPVMIQSERPNKKGIQIKEVLRKPGDPLGTRVRIARANGQDAVIGFEEKFLTLTPPPAAAPANPPNGGAGRPPGAQQDTNGTPGPPPRPPRRPIVQPGQSGSANPQSNQGGNNPRP